MAGNFVHLNVHSEYSLLNNYSPMDKLIKKAKELNFKALAITDYNNMYGVLDFYKKCNKNSIKPIIGCELTLKYPNNEYYNIILLCKNNNGYKNLCKLCSNIYVVENRYDNFITFGELIEYSRDLILIVGSRRSYFYKSVINNSFELAKKELLNFKDIFKKDDLYLELNFNFEDNDEKNINTYLNIANELNINIVATNDVHYIDSTDFNLFKIARCVGKGIELSELKDNEFKSAEYYLKDSNDMGKIFESVPDAIRNTQMIADRCNVEFDFSTYHLPEYIIPDKYSCKEDYLYSLILNGMKNRYKNITDVIKDRVSYEFSVIEKMGFVDYFLIVWDFVKYAKQNGIPVGPGRGSGANSIIAYCLEITDVDPMKYDLIFERFLNPERISMPDFDIDFCNERREEVINYVINKYGKDRVSQIITFGTMQPRAAIRDIGRVLGYKLSVVDKVAKLIPNAKAITFKEALEVNSELRNLYDNNIEIKKLINISEKFESFHRHTSIHAAGIIITKENLTEYIPLSKSGDNIVTQFNMIELEELGLLKIDFLGLRTLTVINDAVELVKKNYNKDINISNIDLKDEKVIDLFRRADTIGVFQFESVGMRLFLKDLKSDSFEELVAANSLFRPGPMNEIPKYINNKNNPSKIKYIEPRLEKYLKSTYGIIVYQEQVMQIARELAGYSWGQADNLRKAIGKKNMEIMEHNRKIFIYGMDSADGKEIIKGCIRNGVSEELATKIFDLIIEFGNYAFNKSHSVSYTLNAFRTAYLKCYYPKEYMVSLLNSVISYEKQFFQYFQECKNMKIKFLLPDINKSEYKLTTENGNIRIGFSQIKGFSRIIAKEIVTERQKYPFKSFVDFLNRLKNTKNFNLSSIESLIKSGAFDNLDKSRSEILNTFEDLYNQIVLRNKTEISGQLNLIKFDYDNQPIKVKNKYSKFQILEFEKDVLGFYISAHPLDEYSNLINNYNGIKISDIKNLNKGVYKLIVFINNIKKRINKKNRLIKTISVEDFSGNIDILDVNDLIQNKGEVLEITIKVSLNSFGNISYTLVDSKKIDSIFLKKVYIKVDEFTEESKKFFIEITNKYKGSNPVFIYIEKDKKSIKLNGSIDITNKELVEVLSKTFKDENIKLR